MTDTPAPPPTDPELEAELEHDEDALENGAALRDAIGPLGDEPIGSDITDTGLGEGPPVVEATVVDELEDDERITEADRLADRAAAKVVDELEFDVGDGGPTSIGERDTLEARVELGLGDVVALVRGVARQGARYAIESLDLDDDLLSDPTSPDDHRWVHPLANATNLAAAKARVDLAVGDLIDRARAAGNATQADTVALANEAGIELNDDDTIDEPVLALEVRNLVGLAAEHGALTILEDLPELVVEAVWRLFETLPGELPDLEAANNLDRDALLAWLEDNLGVDANRLTEVRFTVASVAGTRHRVPFAEVTRYAELDGNLFAVPTGGLTEDGRPALEAAREVTWVPVRTFPGQAITLVDELEPDDEDELEEAVDELVDELVALEVDEDGVAQAVDLPDPDDEP